MECDHRIDGWVKAMVCINGMMHGMSRLEGWARIRGGRPRQGGWGCQRGRRQGLRVYRVARGGDSVAAGAGGRGSRPARVAHYSNRGLTQVWHASESGIELRPLGSVMLGVFEYLFSMM